ncbi:MAG: hypothetical protein ACR2P7_07545 [bacterium]
MAGGGVFADIDVSHETLPAGRDWRVSARKIASNRLSRRLVGFLRQEHADRCSPTPRTMFHMKHSRRIGVARRYPESSRIHPSRRQKKTAVIGGLAKNQENLARDGFT